MKAFLLYRDRDFDPQQPAPPQAQALKDDLALEALLSAMAPDDKFLRDVARAVVLTSSVDLETLRYRQAILQDCLRHPEVVREIYGVTEELLAAKRQLYFYGMASRFPSSVLSSAITMMQMLVSLLKRLAQIAEEHAHAFRSEGFVTLFATLRRELDSDLATLIRTVVILFTLAAFVWLAGKWVNPLTLSSKTLGFLLLSGLATGASWVCYFRALKLGEASKVAPVDKLSVVLVAIFAFAFLAERPSPREWLGIAMIGAGVVVMALKI